MKILLIDNEDTLVPLLQGRLQAAGHHLSHMPGRAEAFDVLKNERFDAVIIDPSPQVDLRMAVNNLRRIVGRHTYVFLSGRQVDKKTAWQSGANDGLTKPFEPDFFAEKIGNAERLIKMIRHLGDDREDFPSANGIIAKSAFNQLFLSGIERADRYGEQAYVLFFTIANHDVLAYHHGKQAAEFASAGMAAELSRLRRMSDIMGQTGPYQYALILQRPNTPEEPLEAAKRFTEALARVQGLTGAGQKEAAIHLQLVTLPQGAVVFEQQVNIMARQVA